MEIHSRIVAIEGGYRGHEGVRRWCRDLFEFIPDYRLEVREIEELEDGIVVELRAGGHGAVSDAPLEETIWQSAVWRDGKCLWWKISQTKAEALAAFSARG